MKKTHAKSGSEDKANAAKAAARNTTSRPSKPSSETGGDPLAEQGSQTQALVASMPYNANKPSEFGHANAVAPSAGATAKPASPAVTASTLSESNASPKTGSPALRIRSASSHRRAVKRLPQCWRRRSAPGFPRH